MKAEPTRPSRLILFQQPALWRMLLSGNRTQIAEAVTQLNTAGLVDEYAALLLVARRRSARRTRRLFGVLAWSAPYSERERRSALTALGLLWGTLGRELGTALDPKASHFDRRNAYQALGRRRDQRAVRPLIDALLEGHALEDWQCIPTLAALGDQSAVEALLRYIDLGKDREAMPPRNMDHASILDIGVEVGRALRALNARTALSAVESGLRNAVPTRRAAAALALAGWGDEKLAADIVPLLDDQVSWVRVAAATALGELEAPDALDAVRTRLADSDSDVRVAAERATQQLAAIKAQRNVQASNAKRPDFVRR